MRTPRFRPARQMLQLDAQEGALNGIQPSVVAFDIVVILARLAMIPQHSRGAGQLVVVRRDGASLAARSQILAGIKTERGGPPHRAGAAPALVALAEVLGAMR